jgi:signal transduction histidine kinase
VAAVGSGEPWRTFGELATQAGITGTLHRKQVTDPFSQRIWDVAADSARGPEGESRTVAVARDITNLVHLESSARRNEVAAEMGRLVVNVAHEVRNPLFGISATVDTLELVMATEDPVIVRFIRNLRLEVTRMTALMQDLLDYGKPPAVAIGLERSSTPVIEAVRAVSHSAAARGVTVENRVADHGSVLIDLTQIEQALHNVIQNAVQHSAEGSRVRVESSVSEGGSDRWVHWSVEDSGPGFSSEAMQSAFEPFFTTRSDGTGLGLSIVRRTMDMHGGRVTVENRHEGGGRVTIALPLQREPS